MIELYELRQLAAFAEAGTLSEAAEVLHLSQPALSRNMKKLEEDLGISLFERSKNKLELNKNGEYALELARKLLDDADSFITRVRDFDRKSRTITPWDLRSSSRVDPGSDDRQPVPRDVFADGNGPGRPAVKRSQKQRLSISRHPRKPFGQPVFLQRMRHVVPAVRPPERP